ncbi:hypothetical protein M0804_004725 [Polistes exclamans]|nr:hypothetical protein M0804_004725 [Polistes exclamans]
MGEPKPASSPQPNGGVKQKPTSLNLAPGPTFYRNVNGRASLNDRHLQHVTAIISGGHPARVGKSISPSPIHVNNEPAPIPASGANKIRSTPNGLPQPTAPRRPHSIAAPPYHHGITSLHQSYGQLPCRTTSSALSSSSSTSSSTAPPPPPASATSGPTATPSDTSWATIGPTTNSSSNGIPGMVQRRAHSVAGTPVSLSTGCNDDNDCGSGIPIQQESRSNGSALCNKNGITVVSSSRSVVPPQSLWNGQLQQPVPRRPHSIASTPVTGSTGTPVSSSTVTPAGLSSATRIPGEPIQWGSSGMVLHQPIPRRAYPSTLPHPQPPTPTTQGPGLSVLVNPGNSNTWTPGAGLRARPHSIASTPQGAPIPPASPSDSGYRSLPSSSSDYQILKSPSRSQQRNKPNQSQQQQQQSAVRRLSLPSAQTLLRTNAPRPSPTFHGLPFRPFTCGVSPNGNPIFLGCTHLHGGGGSGSGSASGSGSGFATGSTGTRTSTPATSPATPLTTSQAIQQLLAQPRNGFKIVDDKVSLFIEILDTQERFAKVSGKGPRL